MVTSTEASRTPVHRFARANGINTFGTGLYLTLGTLYLTQVLGFTAAQVAFAIGCGTGIGLLTAVPLGRVADVVGARQVYAALLALQTICMIGYSLVSSFPAAVVIAVFSGISDRGVAGIAGGLVHALSTRDNRLVARAQLRTTTNIGIGLGTLAAGLAVAEGSGAAYRSAILLNGLMYAVAAALVLRLPGPSASPVVAATSAAVRRQRPGLRYMLVSASAGVLNLQVTVLSFLLPLWIVTQTRAPVWSVSMIVATNTIVVVFAQVRVSKKVHDLPSATRATIVAVCALVAACGAMLVTPHLSAGACVAVLVAWSVLFTIAELYQSSSQFYYSFELAPDDAQSTFQSAFSLGPGVARALGPGLLTLVVMNSPSWGWIALAGVFVLGGAATVATSRWAAWPAPVASAVGARL